MPHAPAGAGECFVHAGTHKTGTTTIQRFLAANERIAADAGLYYPRAGRWTADQPGHHNIAFAMLNDPRLDRARGTLADAVREIARVRPERACLSSELFGYLHEHAEALAGMRDAIAAIGYRPRVVVYVRAQDAYAESLYAEAAKHDMTLPFTRYVDDVIRAGAWVRAASEQRPGRVSAFAYGPMTDAFARAFGEDAVTVRAYRDTGRAETLLLEFLDAVGIGGRLPAETIAGGAAYANRRMTTGSVVTNLFANTAQLTGDDALAAAGAALVARHPDEADQPFCPLAPEERRRIAARFAADNARLVARWGAAAAVFESAAAREDDGGAARRAREFFAHAEAIRAAAAPVISPREPALGAAAQQRAPAPPD